MTTTDNNHTITLYYREGPADKIYQASIQSTAEGSFVHFAYGRRGSTLTTGIKNSVPVNAAEAERIYQKLVRSKISKGYTPGEAAVPYTTATHAAGEDSGVRCQLLNSIDRAAVTALLCDDRWCLQQKFDGRRLLIRKQGDVVTGINRRGFHVEVPEQVAHAALELPFNFLIDGEAVGDTLQVFDLLQLRGRSLESYRYLDRLSRLLRWIDTRGAIEIVPTVTTFADKSALFTRLRKSGAEGVVFKDLAAPVTAGRPASGGSQLKFKFVETASFIVRGPNSKRSIGLALFDNWGHLVPAGNVTIPANFEVPKRGDIVEVRYLYAHAASGSVYQPVYLGPRSDIDACDCTTLQLKFKTCPASIEAR